MLLNILIDAATINGSVRKLIRYAANRSEGLQHGSYELANEASLALSFAESSGGGGEERVIIDAGANLGDWSRKILANKSMFETLLVIEPQSIHIPSLQKLSGKNVRVVVEQVAIGAAPGELTIYADKAGSRLASLYKRNLKHVGLSMMLQEVVQITTLDALAEKHDLRHIAYLKLDLEGHELEALKGAEKLLERNAIDAISFEFGGCNIDSRTYIKDFWSLLVDRYHFSLYRLLPKQRLKRLSEYSESLEQFSWQNILACAPNITPKWMVLD
jgi:FkbM family methyltransferase